jgi:hypothetical protein
MTLCEIVSLGASMNVTGSSMKLCSLRVVLICSLTWVLTSCSTEGQRLQTPADVLLEVKCSLHRAPRDGVVPRTLATVA